MNQLHPLLAAWNMDEMQGKIELVIKIAATVVGAAVGWFVSGPLFSVIYRLFSPRKGISGELLIPLRLLSAAGVAAIVYFFLHFGIGGWGGLGSGGGQGNGIGKGKDGNGQNGQTDPDSTGKDPSSKPNDPQKTNPASKVPPENIVIELVPSKEKKYYVVKHKDRQDPPRNFEEVEKMVKENKGNYVAHITFAQDAPSSRTLTFTKLRELLEGQKVPHTQDKE